MDRILTISQIRTAAIDAQAYRACQLLQALANVIEHKKLELGYPGPLSIDKACEENAIGMLDSALACLADDPPLPVRQSIAAADVHSVLDPDDLDSLVELVTNDYQQMFGGFQNEE